MGSYGSDIGRGHAIHMSWEGGKVAGRRELIEELGQPCPHFISDGVPLQQKHNCDMCWKLIIGREDNNG
jgi:hypothetical protein